MPLACRVAGNRLCFTGRAGQGGMSDNFWTNFHKAGSPFRTPATSLDQSNAYALYDLTHPQQGGHAGGGGASGIGYLLIGAVAAVFALVAAFGAIIAGLMIWAVQRFIPGVRADFENAVVTSFFGMFAISIIAFGMALALGVAGAIWPAAEDIAYAADVEITSVIAGNIALKSMMAVLLGEDVTGGFAGDAPVPLMLGLAAKAALYGPGVVVFAILLARRIDFGVRRALLLPVSFAAALVLLLACLPLAALIMAALAPHAALAPVFDGGFFDWLIMAVLGGGGVILVGAVLAAIAFPLMVRTLGVGRLPVWAGFMAGLTGFAAYTLITLCVMLVFRQGDGLIMWADAVVSAPNPVLAVFSGFPAMIAAMSGFFVVQLPGVLALGRFTGSALRGTRGVAQYAVSCLASQLLALVAVPVGLLLGIAAINMLLAALGL